MRSVLAFALCAPCLWAGAATAQLDPTAPVPPRVLGLFVPSGNLIEGPRFLHTSTVWTEASRPGTLDNPVGISPLETRGFILVTGGGRLSATGTIHFLDTAEAYGPFVDVAGLVQFPSVQPVGPMASPRLLHTSTLLDDGRILVAGGQSAFGLQSDESTVETYDPTTQSFTGVGSMTTPRIGHRAVRLPDGKVLVVGGLRGVLGEPSCSSTTSCPGEALASAELFDPVTNTFTPTGSMATGRALGHSATLLSDGRVLVAGGVTNPDDANGLLDDGELVPALASTEIYDPATGSFTTGPTMASARTNHTATRLFGIDPFDPLLGARVLVAGGSARAGVNLIFDSPLASAETYNPVTETFLTEGSMGAARTHHAATLLPHGKVLVTGGQTELPGGGQPVIGSAELYDPGQGPNPLFGGSAGSFVATLLPMSQSRGGHTSTRTPTGTAGTAVIIGGASPTGTLATTETYVP